MELRSLGVAAIGIGALGVGAAVLSGCALGDQGGIDADQYTENLFGPFDPARDGIDATETERTEVEGGGVFRHSVARAFAAADANGDAVASWGELRELVGRSDADGDGWLTVRETKDFSSGPHYPETTPVYLPPGGGRLGA